jgi:hypothetical protein
MAQATSTQIEKVMLRTNQGKATGTVYCLETTYFDDGTKSYFFVMQDGEFGKAFAWSHYKRLPKKIRNYFI